MRRSLAAIVLMSPLLFFGAAEDAGLPRKIELPKPQLRSGISFEEAVSKRRSQRAFSGEALSLSEIGQLLWAAQGITDAARGLRSAPSAGALYPLEVYAVTAEGVFHYLPAGHGLEKTKDGDLRSNLSRAALGQPWVATSGLDIVICADPERVTRKYGERGIRYVWLEAGHAAQNVLLQAVSMGLGAVPVGAFSSAEAQTLLGVPKDWEPLYIIPVGRLPK